MKLEKGRKRQAEPLWSPIQRRIKDKILQSRHLKSNHNVSDKSGQFYSLLTRINTIVHFNQCTSLQKSSQTDRQKPRLACLLTVAGVVFHAEPQRNIFSTGIDLWEGNLRRGRKADWRTDGEQKFLRSKQTKVVGQTVSCAYTVPGREASTSAQAVWTTASSGQLASSPTQTR